MDLIRIKIKVLARLCTFLNTPERIPSLFPLLEATHIPWLRTPFFWVQSQQVYLFVYLSKLHTQHGARPRA